MSEADINTQNRKPTIVGVILAGGLARRMGGGDKCLQSLGDKTLLARCIQRAQPQVDALLLNANGDLSRFANMPEAAALAKASDIVTGFAGPLAGILTGMHWARQRQPQAEWLLSIASDTPFFPPTLAQQLLQRARQEKALIAVAESNDQIHPVFGLWHTSLIEDLRHALVEEDIRKIFQWIKRHPWTSVSFDHTPQSDTPRLDPFFNINSPDDLSTAEQAMAPATKANNPP